MVKIGFIVEGPSDARIIRSEKFQQLLHQLNLEFIDIIVPEGKGHFFHPKSDFTLIESKVSSYLQILKDKGAASILFLVDQDEEPCFTSVKGKIPFSNQNSIVICKRSLEAWYLADQSLMSTLLKSGFSCNTPEEFTNPFEEIKNLLQEKTGRGIGDKILLAGGVIKEGFSIENAAQNPGCASAQYFIKKLQSISR